MDPDQGTVPKGPAASSGPVCDADVLDVMVDDPIGGMVVGVRVEMGGISVFEIVLAMTNHGVYKPAFIHSVIGTRTTKKLCRCSHSPVFAKRSLWLQGGA